MSYRKKYWDNFNEPDWMGIGWDVYWGAGLLVPLPPFFMREYSNTDKVLVATFQNFKL